LESKKSFQFKRKALKSLHDKLPKRMEIPILSGPAKGLKVEKPNELLEEAYEGFGWDKETGYIKEETLKRLGLDDIIDYLRKINKIK
jgi:Aldehyde:ferredoxin oxidoreductase